MDTKASLQISDLVTDEVFAAHWMQSQSQYNQMSATNRWAMIWSGVDFHIIGLMVPDKSFLGVILSWQRDRTLWRSEMFAKHGYPLAISFCKTGSDIEEFTVGCIIRVLEEEELTREGITEYDAAFAVQTPLTVSEIIEDWREEYLSWQDSESKNVWDQKKPLDDGSL